MLLATFACVLQTQKLSTSYDNVENLVLRLLKHAHK